MGLSNSQHRAAISALTAVGEENPAAREYCQLIRRGERLKARLDRLKLLAARTKDETALKGLATEGERRQRELAHLADRIEAAKPKDFDLAKALAELAAEADEVSATE